MKVFFTIIFTLSLCLSASASFSKKPNVLIIFIDDLNSDISSFGDSHAITPNFDRLAARGVTFTDAYCQSPACNTSRAAILSGLYPYRTGIHDNAQPVRTALPSRIMMPQWFRQNGYYTAAYGKIFHWKGPQSHYGDPASWDVSQHPQLSLFSSRPNTERIYANTIVGPGTGAAGLRIEVWDSPLDSFVDGITTTSTITRMRDLESSSNQPWLLCCGLILPHLDWDVPKHFWDMHDVSELTFPEELPLSEQRVPLLAGGGNPDATVEIEQRREAHRAYRAAVSYIDWNIGRLLDEVDALGVQDETIIVMLSDHGFSLGEHGRFWQKWNLWDEACRTPLCVASPGASGNGQICSRVVELQDVFPTLFGLCGLPPYPSMLDGKSLVPLLEKPNQEWNFPAFTERALFKNFRLGKAIRYGNYRFIEWKGEYQCFDLSIDPLEQNNLVNVGAPGSSAGPVARDPAMQPLVDRLRSMFDAETDFSIQQRSSSALPSEGEVVDRDGDGLSLDEEIEFGSSDLIADTDGDGISDQVEKMLNFKPRGDDSERIESLRENRRHVGLMIPSDLLAGRARTLFDAVEDKDDFKRWNIKIRFSEDLKNWEEFLNLENLPNPLSGGEGYFSLDLKE